MEGRGLRHAAASRPNPLRRNTHPGLRGRDALRRAPRLGSPGEHLAGGGYGVLPGPPRL